VPIWVVAGASGYIGQHLVGRWRRAGDAVRTIGRGPRNDGRWSDEASLHRALDGADVLVNLAGRSVSCRYTKSNADAIFSSRTETTAALGRALGSIEAPPPVWLNASTGTIYRDARDRPQDERTGELGTGFSVAVARAWERELFEAQADVRRIALRMSIVLGPGGGAVNPLINMARVGFGGPMGDGAQVFSWIHVADVARAIEHLVGHREIDGPVNLATPHAVTNAELMASMRDAVGRRIGIGSPAWWLEFGGRVIRTEPELVLKSRWVEPRVLQESGFEFAHPFLDSALTGIVERSPRGLLPVALG